jgi:hypothetical protein
MTNDMKLGLISGVAGVLAVALFYFPKQPAMTVTPGAVASAGNPVAASSVVAAPVAVSGPSEHRPGTLTGR